MGNNRVEEKKVEEKKPDPKEVFQSLRVQLTEHQKQSDEHQKQSEYHSTMAIKAQGALEVLLQMHPELQENK